MTSIKRKLPAKQQKLSFGKPKESSQTPVPVLDSSKESRPHEAPSSPVAGNATDNPPSKKSKMECVSSAEKENRLLAPSSSNKKCDVLGVANGASNTLPVKDDMAIERDQDEDGVHGSSDSSASSDSEGDGGDERMCSTDAVRAVKTTATKLAALLRSPAWQPSVTLPKETDAPLVAGKCVPYIWLCRVFARVSATSSRLECIVLVANALREVMRLCPDHLLAVVSLTANQVAPPHEGVELGVGDALITKCIAETSGRTPAAVTALYASLGDLGAVAEQCKKAQRTLVAPKSLTVDGVLALLRKIASTSGRDARGNLIKSAFVAARGVELQFLIRALQGKLRIGFAMQSVILCLAAAAAMLQDKVRSETALQAEVNVGAEIISRAYSACPSLDVIVPAIASSGIDGAARIGPRVGTPLKPMLAKAANGGLAEVRDRLGALVFTADHKYDGERAQIHWSPASAAGRTETWWIYSRNGENHSTKFPDVTAALQDARQEPTQAVRAALTTSELEQLKNMEGLPPLDTQTEWPPVSRHDVVDAAEAVRVAKLAAAAHKGACILDAEVVAWDPEADVLKDFQALQHRARKSVALGDVKVPVVTFLFDCMMIAGEDCRDLSLFARRRLLRALFCRKNPNVRLATSRDFAPGLWSNEDLLEWMGDAVTSRTEGLMLKAASGPSSQYAAGARSSWWLKLKKDYMGTSLGDSLDLVPIGAYHGKGKRTGTYGGYLLAVYDDESDEYQSICKVGTGFSDEQLATLTEGFADDVVEQMPFNYRVGEPLKPDVWLKPSAVWECRAADLSISPVHKAGFGRVASDKGIALRFPRLIRVRTDKDSTAGTTASQIIDIYEAQCRNGTAAATVDRHEAAQQNAAEDGEVDGASGDP